MYIQPRIKASNFEGVLRHLNTMAITVLFFGQLAEAAGVRTVSLNGISSTAELKTVLYSKYPEMKNILFNIAVDAEIADGDIPVHAGSTIALLPPFSGG